MLLVPVFVAAALRTVPPLCTQGFVRQRLVIPGSALERVINVNLGVCNSVP